MKKLVAVVALIALASGVMAAKKAEKSVEKASESVKPSVSAELSFEMKGDRLYCFVALTGVAKGDKVEPCIYSTPPETAQVFSKDMYRSPMVRTKTKSYRTVVTTIGKKEIRAVGIWKFSVKVDGVEVGSGEYEVK
jgi:hypothetical protein